MPASISRDLPAHDPTARHAGTPVESHLVSGQPTVLGSAALELARSVGRGTSTQTGAHQGGYPIGDERYCRRRIDRWWYGQDAGADCTG